MTTRVRASARHLERRLLRAVEVIARHRIDGDRLVSARERFARDRFGRPFETGTTLQRAGRALNWAAAAQDETATGDGAAAGSLSSAADTSRDVAAHLRAADEPVIAAELEQAISDADADARAEGARPPVPWRDARPRRTL